MEGPGGINAVLPKGAKVLDQQNTTGPFHHARTIRYECDQAQGYCGNGTLICAGDGNFHHDDDAEPNPWTRNGTSCKRCSK